MQQVRLGPSGTLVSELALGTMTFGAETDADTAVTMLDAFVDRGGTLVELADVYAGGESESIVGRWLERRHDRDRLVIATKARFATGDGPNDAGLSRGHLQRAVEASLRRLRTEVIDLYQCHAWDPLTPVEETVETLADLVTSGRIRHVGVSNVTGWQLERFRAVGSDAGIPIVTLQPQYNLLAREVEWELLPLCADQGIGVLPWSPLGGGWLTGKYRRGERPTGATRLGEDPDRGVEAFDRRDTEHTWRIVDVVADIAQDRGVPMSHVAVNWLRAREVVTSVIIGARTVDQLLDNLGAVGWHLSADERARLEEVSEPTPPDYPYGLLRELGEDRRLP